jgi:nucleoside-diphosphate-sugar epimerase
VRDDHGFNLHIGRLFTFSGKHLIINKNYALSQFFQMAEENGLIKVSGHPNSMRSYMDARDMARWIYKTIHIMPEMEYLQIGSSVGVTFAELAEYVGSLFQVEVSYTNKEDGIEYYLPQNESTANLLGEKEIYSWKESVNFSFESNGR